MSTTDEDATGERTPSVASAIIMAGAVLGLLIWLSVVLGLPFKYLAITFGLQWGFFLLHGWPQRSEQLYDASGSLTHVSLVIAALLTSTTRTPRQIVTSICAIMWCTRLGAFLFDRILGDKQDTRFTELKKNFWSFSIAWTLQVAWVFLLELPIMIVNTQTIQPPVGILDCLGWSAWVTGFLVEAVADAQKSAFRKNPQNKGRYITSGLWRFSRHPNYFGELLMWIGLCISCSAFLRGWQLLAWLSPGFSALLLLGVSGVPMLEKAGEKRWGSEPGYVHYMQNTSCVIPWRPAPLLKDSDDAEF